MNLDDECQAAMSRITYAINANANYELKKIRLGFAFLEVEAAALEYHESPILKHIHPAYGMKRLADAVFAYEKAQNYEPRRCNQNG